MNNRPETILSLSTLQTTDVIRTLVGLLKADMNRELARTSDDTKAKEIAELNMSEARWNAFNILNITNPKDILLVENTCILIDSGSV